MGPGSMLMWTGEIRMRDFALSALATAAKLVAEVTGAGQRVSPRREERTRPLEPRHECDDALRYQSVFASDGPGLERLDRARRR